MSKPADAPVHAAALVDAPIAAALADAPARADTPIAAALADVPARADKQIDAPIDAAPFDAPAQGTPGAAGSTDAWAPVGMSRLALLPPPADRADALSVPLQIGETIAVPTSWR